jgi:class 3 adenylate cyclase
MCPDSTAVSADQAAPPSGVATFLFTDVEGSTRRWEKDANATRAALAAHDLDVDLGARWSRNFWAHIA